MTYEPLDLHRKSYPPGSSKREHVRMGLVSAIGDLDRSDQILLQLMHVEELDTATVAAILDMDTAEVMRSVDRVHSLLARI